MHAEKRINKVHVNLSLIMGSVAEKFIIFVEEVIYKIYFIHKIINFCSQGCSQYFNTILNILYKDSNRPTRKTQRYPVTVSWLIRSMAGSEPLFQEADPPIIEA